MKNKNSEIHPQLRFIAAFKPRLKLNRTSSALIKRALPWVIWPRSNRDVAIENVWINRQDVHPQLRLRVYRPKNAANPSPTMLWLHGGGYVLGTPEMNDRTCIEFARSLGLVVISVDYRLAPAHPFPAALEDAWAALNWMAVHAQELALDPARIAIGGVSAGGGLAAALAQLACDREDIQPAFQLLIYPMLDDRTVLRDDIRDKDFLVWPHSSNRFGWESYIRQPCGENHVPPYAVPARRDNLSGLPPVWIGVGTLDMFHDEDVGYAKRLRDSGIEVTLDVVPGAFHGFDVLRPRSALASAFREAQMAALKKSLKIS